MVAEGWMNQETGKRAEPRIQFVEVEYLQDVLKTYAKKLVLLLNIQNIEAEFISKLNQLFQQNKGQHTVTFEVMELEKVRKTVTIAPTEIESIEEIEEAEFVEINENDEDENLENSTQITASKTEEIEEVQVITKLVMPSRKAKITISNELLTELERLQVNFKLN